MISLSAASTGLVKLAQKNTVQSINPILAAHVYRDRGSEVNTNNALRPTNAVPTEDHEIIFS